MAAAEDDKTGAYYSIGSLINTRKGGTKTACNSEPFLKPKLGLTKLKDLLFKKIQAKVQKGIYNDPEQTEFSMEDSKKIIRELAVELNRLFPLRELAILSEERDDKVHQEESQTLVLQWADELSCLQQKQKQGAIQMPEDLKTTASHEDSQNLDKEQRLKDANTILSDWTRKLRSKESVQLREEYKAVLQDLCKQWKKGQLYSILPIVDFLIRILLQENQNQESILKQWFRTERVFKKAGALYIPTPAEIVLDSNTANPELMLSKDGRSVRTKTHEESKPNPWSEIKHSRYDGWTCVQAKQGYTTGRHYWEVDVKKKRDWRIGVVKESAPRRGFVKMNTTAGYWTLRLQLGSLMALTDPVTKLNHLALSRIGVYLDMEEGRVSFYDPLTKRHIYTFKTALIKSEKMYPVFGTVETDRALRIMQVWQ
ncbi:hypothetical protein NFI96_017928 [Prochilodus magdalenae]|nr:hypothetical protein NFI96_017928 [Prochilodus magdalenae]